MKRYKKIISIIKNHNKYTTNAKLFFIPLISRRLYFIIMISLLLIYQWIKAIRGKFSFEESKHTSIKILCLLERIGIKFEIEGLSSLREVNKPVIFVSNHMSALETLILPVDLVQPLPHT